MKIIEKLYKKYEEIINYFIVGILTTMVSLGSYYLCVCTFLNPNNAIELQIANLVSWVCAVVFSYVTNRAFVFKSKNKNQIKEIISFVSSRILTLFMDMAIMFIGVTLLHISDKVTKLVVQVVVTVMNYILSKWFVFKKKNT
jgi:putative flippase GtrA